MHSARWWRLLRVVLSGILGQFSGNGLGYFNLLIYEAISYFNMQLILVNNILCALGALTGVALQIEYHLCKILVIGTFLASFWLGINGGLSKVWVDNDQKGTVGLSVGRGDVAEYFFPRHHLFVYLCTSASLVLRRSP